MATVSGWNPFGVALDITATNGGVTRTSATQYTVKINASWEAYYSGAKTNYGMKVTSGGQTAYIPKFSGSNASSGSGSLTGAYSISGNGSQTKTISVVFENYNDLGDSATKTLTFDVTVPAWTSYTVSYNANGGSGAPSSQTKWKDQTLTLSSTKPTRSGYTFVGWGTSTTDTTADYSAGGSYTANASDTLYAIWKKTITLTYNANGGSGAPSTQNATIYNATTNYKFTLSSTKPTKTGYTFLGWSTSNTATSSSYAAGGSITLSDSDTLYAVWSENALTVNYYSNYADYATFQGATINVSASTNVLVHSQKFYYDNAASSGLADVQNTEYVYISRTGYTSTGYWGTATDGGTLINQSTTYNTGQALAQALGKNLASGNASINLYPQWLKNTYMIGYDGNRGYGSMDVQLVDWQETFTLLDNKFKREGYKFVGWNVQRDTDRKWYVNGQGWVTEDEITENGYEKKLYSNQDELIFDMSWIRGDTGIIHQYTMYAVWEIAGVVYIDNSITFEPYLAYIDNGSGWDLYLAYVDDGTEWKIIS